MFNRLRRDTLIALLLVGSAILLYSCGEQEKEDNTAQDETLMTGAGENLTIIESRSGRKSYHFTTPLLEEYALARDPYREFRKGVDITTYKDDSTSSVDGTLTANYAIYYMKRNLWEAKGNVVVKTANGRELYTQQLFWNSKTRRIYSNVDSKIVQNEGKDVYYGEGFESDEQMKDWRFRRMTGKMEFELRTQSDSTQMADSVANRPSPQPQSKKKAPTQVIPRPKQEYLRGRKSKNTILPTIKKPKQTAPQIAYPVNPKNPNSNPKKRDKR